MQSFYPKITGIAIFLLLIVTGLDGLRNVRLEGPSHVRAGEDVVLRCHYELENDSLYTVKWFRGSKEFYRFVPKEVPPKRFFLGPGLSFNEQYCNEHEIFLKNVSLETSAKFKCAVSAEMTFQTFVVALDFAVVVVDEFPPKIEVEQQSYYPGENVRANCSVTKVSHTLNFTWYVNGQEVPSSLSKRASIPDESEPSLLKSVSLLQFEMGLNLSSANEGRTSLNGDDTRLKCKAELFDLYSLSSQEITIQTTQPRYSPSNQDTLRRSSVPTVSSGAPGFSFIKRNLIVLLLVLLLLTGWEREQSLHFLSCL